MEIEGIKQHHLEDLDHVSGGREYRESEKQSYKNELSEFISL